VPIFLSGFKIPAGEIERGMYIQASVEEVEVYDLGVAPGGGWRTETCGWHCIVLTLVSHGACVEWNQFQGVINR